MPDRRYQPSSGRIRGKSKIFDNYNQFVDRGSGVGAKEYMMRMKTEELGLDWAKLSFEQKKWAEQLADNEIERRQRLQELAIEGANAKDLAKVNSEYAIKEKRIQNELDIARDNNKGDQDRKTGDASAMNKEGYLSDQRDMYVQDRTPILRFESQFQQQNPDMMASRIRGAAEKDMYSNQLARANSLQKMTSGETSAILDPSVFNQGISSATFGGGGVDAATGNTIPPSLKMFGPTGKEMQLKMPIVQPNTHEAPAQLTPNQLLMQRILQQQRGY